MASRLNHHISGLTLYQMSRYWWKKCLLLTSLPDYVSAACRYPAALSEQLYTQKGNLWLTKWGAAPKTVINEVHVYCHRISNFLFGFKFGLQWKNPRQSWPGGTEGICQVHAYVGEVNLSGVVMDTWMNFCDDANGMLKFLKKCAGSSTWE